MSVARRAVLPAFTPTAVPAAELAERTVGREDVQARLVDRLHTAAGSTERPHVLIVGPRGSGKTHLLRVVIHEALCAPTAVARLAVVVLPEDAPEIASYEDLLFGVIERLAESDQGEIVAQARPARRDSIALERLVEALLGDRVLVLVIENLNRMFEDMGVSGQGRLRAFTETSERVMIMASTPLLFGGVSEHAEPWYGAFHVEHLQDLTTDEGAELLRRLATAGTDADLAAFLATPAARGRLEAVTRLTGGSPRMWTVLAGCLTVELLDELVPLVKAMLDDLVPYYQERLNNLAANERKLVVELSRSAQLGPNGDMTMQPTGMLSVTDLAERCGLDRAVAATSLGRLHDARWVRRVKAEGTDQRVTWYELREPMLRHHLQYRETRGETLRVIVAFLRDWYSPMERLRHFATVEAESIAERYLRDAALLDHPASNAPYAGADVDKLVVGARVWLDDTDAGTSGLIRSRLAAIAAEAVALTVSKGVDAATGAAERRIAGSFGAQRDLFGDVATAAIDAARASGDGDTEDRARVAAGLKAALSVAAGRAEPRDEAALVLMTAGWNGACGNVDEGRRLLDGIRATLQDDEDRALRLAIDAEEAAIAWQGNQVENAVEMGTAVLRERRERLGADHPDTLASAERLAGWASVMGDHETARSLWSDVVDGRVRVVGAGHPDTLTARERLADEAFQAGAVDQAWELLGALVPELERRFGASDTHVLNVRTKQAALAGITDRFDYMCVLFERLAKDLEDELGADAPATLQARAALAIALNVQGESERARAIFDDIVFDHGDAFDPDDIQFFRVRGMHAAHIASSGEAEEAVSLLSDLVGDATRVFGEADPQTLEARIQHAQALAACREYERARSLFDALMVDATAALGADHDVVMTARHERAKVLGQSGEHAEAVSQLTDLVAERKRRLGSEHPDTLASRVLYGEELAAAGQSQQGLEELVAVADAYRRVDGETSIDAVKVTARQALVLAQAGRTIEGASLAVRMYRRYETASDPNNSPLTALVAVTIAAVSVVELIAAADDKDLEQARAIALASAPGDVLLPWVGSTLALEQDDLLEAVQWLVDEAGQRGIAARLGVAVVKVAATLTVLSETTRVAWLGAWTAALGELEDTNVAIRLLPVVAAVGEGDTTALLSLPVEERQIVEDAISWASQDDLKPGPESPLGAGAARAAAADPGAEVDDEGEDHDK